MTTKPDPMHFWLIQRCRFTDALDPAGVDALFSYDYMGSAEFEFGSLGDSLREIARGLADYRFTETGIRAKDGRWLVLFSRPDDAPAIRAFLAKESEKPQKLKERTRLSDILSGNGGIARNDAWWDIANHWVAFLGNKNGPRVDAAFKASAEKQRAKGRL